MSTTVERWRLVLGRFARPRLPAEAGGRIARLEAAMDFLYAREYRGRGLRGDGGGEASERTAGDGPSAFTIPSWLSEVRELFPRETLEVIEGHALTRYGLKELITDPQTLARIEPNIELLKTLLSFRGMLKGEVLELARGIIRRVVEEIRARWEPAVRRALSGTENRFRHSPVKAARSFDWRGTVEKNLRHVDPERRRLAARELLFFARNARHVSWRVVLCVDQSGSMAESVIHSAVMAGIFAGIPSFQVNLVVFDTEVVDLSGVAGDPVEALLSVQLGGGTNIAKAVRYGETLVEEPRRTVLLLVSDFVEGGDPDDLLASVKRLKEAGVTLLGLAALDAQAIPAHDPQMAARLVDAGMEVAALTPSHLAAWLARVIHSR